MNKFQFSPPNGLLDTSVYPTNPTTEAEARGQIQSPLNQLKEFLNSMVDGFSFLGSANGYSKSPNGFMFQWCEVEANLTATQSVDIAITMLQGFNSSGATGWGNCISNLAGARYINTSVTVTNSLLGTGIARVYASQPVNATVRLKIFMVGW